MDRSKAAKGVLWSVVENGGLAFVSFASLILFSRYLSASEFGLFSIALAIVELIGVLVSMTFHDALVQREHVSSIHFRTAFTVSMSASLVLLSACWILAPYFAELVDDPAGTPVLRWLALCWPSNALSDTLVAKLRRDLKFRELAIRSLVGRLFAAFVGIGLVLLGAGIWALVAQQVLIRLIGSLALLVATRETPGIGFSKGALTDLGRFGFFAVMTLFARLLVDRSFTIVAGVMLGTELAGYLNLSFRAVDALWVIAATAVGQVALPVLARLQLDLPRFRQAYKSALELACLVLYPSFFGIALVAPELVELMFGSRWLGCVPYVQVLALLVVFRVIGLLVKPTLTAIGRPLDPMLGLLFEGGVMAALFVFVGAHSLFWAIAIWTCRELAGIPIMARVLRRATGLDLIDQFRGALLPLFCSLLMSAGVLSLRLSLPELPALLRLFALSLPGALVFVFTVWLFDRSSFLRTKDFFSKAFGRLKPPGLAGASRP